MRLMIVDDHDLVREALSSRLMLMPDMEVVASVSNGEQALEQVASIRPDLIIMDYDMPRMNGAECARRVKEIHPECLILFLTGFPEEEEVLSSVGIAAGYVTKSASWGMLEQALDAVRQGKAYVDPNLVPAIMKRAAAVDQDQHLLSRIDPERQLTPTERRVVVLAARLRSNQQIAEDLSISENTVKAHLQRIFRKLGVHGRKELAARLA